MIELRFGVLRFIIDILFVTIMFFAFMCGVHYGTQLIGLYFWFVKFLLGMASMGLILKVLTKVKATLLFLLKNGSIYAQCCPECKSIIESFGGIFRHFKSTVAVISFNKLIRECLNSVSGKVIESTKESPLVDFLDILNNSKIAKASIKVVIKAFDYVDECILGYCYKNVNDEKGIFDCAVEGFVIFIKNSPKIFEKVLTIISLQIVARITYWVIFCMICWKYVYFGFADFTGTLMNVLLCYCIGKLVNFILDDAVFEPALMHGIINTFSQYTWSDELSELEEQIASSIPAFGKLRNKSSRSTENDAVKADDMSNNGEFCDSNSINSTHLSDEEATKL